MGLKVAVIVVLLFGVAVFVAAYIQRGELAFGGEYILPLILAGVIPIKEES